MTVYVAAPLTGFQPTAGRRCCGAKLAAAKTEPKRWLLGYEVKVVPLDDESRTPGRRSGDGRSGVAAVAGGE